MSDVKEMQLGQVVDFCRSYNERQKRAEEESEPDRRKKPEKPKYKYRLASPSEVDAYFS